MDLDALVAPLRADNISGASALTARAARLVEETAVGAPARTAGELTALLRALLLRVLDAQPSMAPLVALAREVLLSLEGADGLAAAREAASRAAQDLARELGTGVAEVARRAADRLPPGGRVLTLSRSETVRETLLVAARRGRLGEVVCLESRPLREGAALADELARAGTRVLYAVDAALESLVADSGTVLLGADSVGDRGIVNKIGSVAAARAGAAHGLPVLVAVDRSKLLPPGFPQPTGDDRPAAEVWAKAESGGAAAGESAANAHPGVRVWNRYFEVIDPSLVGLVVTQDGALPPAELLARRQALRVPAALREWAVDRLAGPPASEEPPPSPPGTRR